MPVDIKDWEVDEKPVSKPPYAPTIRDPAFAKRIQSAIEAHPHAPDYGALTWVRNELGKRGISVSVETVRKWAAGEAKPRPRKMEALARVLDVDLSWLALGVDAGQTVREQKVRNALADGAVNLVAGLIQMDGGHPAFPTEADKRAKTDNVDLVAIIKGASYSFHITVGEKQGDDFHFVVPNRYENVLVLGVIMDGFKAQIFEIPAEVITDKGSRRGGSIDLLVNESDLRSIDAFTDRI